MKQNAFLSRIGKWLPGFLSLALVMFIGVTLAKLTWHFLTPKQAVVAAPSLSPALVDATVNQPKNYGEEIAKLHIFGEVPKPVKKAPPPAPVAKPKPVEVKKPKIPLKIRVFGVVTGSKEESFAIISGNGKPGQNTYSVGEKILYMANKDEPEEDVILVEVLADRIVVDNRGEKEEFFMPKYDEIDLTANAMGGKDNKEDKGKLAVNNPAPAPQYIAAPAPAQTAPSTIRPPTGFGVGATESRNSNSTRVADKKPTKEITGEQLVQMREQILSDPSTVQEMMSVSQAKDKTGKFIGFRLSPGSKREIFRGLNLRAGDVATSINGIKLDNPQRAFEVMNQVASASSITVTIKRGSQEFTITRDLPPQ